MTQAQQQEGRVPSADEALGQAIIGEIYMGRYPDPVALVAAVRAAGWVPLPEVEKALREFARDEARAGAHFVGVNDAADLVASLARKEES